MKVVDGSSNERGLAALVNFSHSRISLAVSVGPADW
jgi:hypothetical protein